MKGERINVLDSAHGSWSDPAKRAFWENAYGIPPGVLEAIYECPTPARVAQVIRSVVEQ